MATFAESLETKLKSLEPSQTGIQTLSLWIIHHRHHSGIITNAWVDRVKKAKVEKRISLFYLANDVIQNGRKKAKDLVTAFGKAFLDVIHLYRESKNKSQVERVLSIWVERNVYEAGYVDKLKELLNNGVAPQPTSPVKTSPLKVQQKRSSVSSNSNVVQSSTKKSVPANFKVSTLLMSIKKSVSLDSDAERKSKKLEGMRIDATSVDSIKNVKDRSSVGHFHKEFDDSKIMLEDYINTLRHNVQEKQKILPLLNSSEAFYALAQDEAKVIVNAYKTFGNRLNSMKRKLDVKISKLEDDASRTPEEQTDSRGHKMRSSSGGSIQDMDLDSESEDEDVPSSQAYNPSTAPSHEDLAQQGSTPSFLPTNGGMTSFLDSSASAQLLLQQQPMMMSTDIAAIATQQQAVQPDVFQQQQQDSEDQQNTAVKTLIDSLFPVLSKSLQTIKEKTNVGDEKPSVNAAMAFALGDVVNMVQQDEAMADPSKAISPVSLTNPNGLSDHQTELINIAAGVTELDANCQPLSRVQSVDEEKIEKKEKHEEDVERKRDDRKSTSSGRHRHRSHRSDDNRHRRSSSRSPQRRSSHRSSRDDRRDKDRDRGDRRRSSRRSPSPRRRSSKGSRRRSSSRERGEKRKHSSAEEREKPYYNNNRRSPTPEMDATSNTTSATNNPVAATTSPKFLQQNQNQTPQQPIPNDQPQSQSNAKPMMISSFQPVDPNVAQQPAPSIQQRLQQVEEPPQQNFVPSNNTPVAPTFHATNQQQQSTDDNMEQSDDDSQTPTPTIQLAPTQPFPFPNPFENMVPTLNPIMQPPPMNFPPTPMQQAAMNLVRVQNPLQLLQQDTENMPQPPPFVPPPFFAPPQQLPVPPMQPDMNLPTNEQNNLPFNPQQNIFNPPNNMQEDHQAPSFPGPPPVPPQFMQQPQDFNPRGFPQRPEFRPPPPGMNPESFPPIRPDGPGNGMNFRPPQNFDNMPDNDFAPPQQFNQNQNRPPFNDNRPPFRPRFQNNSPRRNFRPRGGNFNNGPRQFRPRHPRPVL